MGVVKSPGKRVPVKNSGKGADDAASGMTKPDNENKDIYFEHDFGTKKKIWNTAAYKDKGYDGDKHSTGSSDMFKDDGPAYAGRPEIKDDKRSNEQTHKLAGNPDINPDPKALPFYNEPPKAPEVPVEPPVEPVKEPKKPQNKTLESNKTSNATAAPQLPKKKKKEWGNMTLSKLVLDSDNWIENNDKYHYRNHKISTARMFHNSTYGSMYYVRMNVGSPPQV